MRYSLLLFVSLSLVACTTSKVIIKNDDGKFKIEKGSSLAITKTGEQYRFDKNCASLCQSCSPELADARGILDSVSTSSLFIQYGTEFSYDTLRFMEVRSIKKKERKKDLYKVERERPGAKFIYRRTLQSITVSVPIDSISMITYSNTLHCNMMAKIKKPFSKPNKLYHIKVEGSKVKTKL